MLISHLALFYLSRPSDNWGDGAEIRTRPYDKNLMEGIKAGDIIELEDKTESLSRWTGTFFVEKVEVGDNAILKQQKTIFYLHPVPTFKAP